MCYGFLSWLTLWVFSDWRESCSVMSNSLWHHGIPQTRILEWVAFPFFKGSFPNQGSNPGLPHCRQILYHLSHKGSPGEVGDTINEVLFNYFFFFSRKIRVPICTPSTVLNQRLQNKQGLKEMGKEKNVIYFLKHTERMSSLLLPWEPRLLPFL